jgi:hypothetical protein
MKRNGKHRGYKAQHPLDIGDRADNKGHAANIDFKDEKSDIEI